MFFKYTYSQIFIFTSKVSIEHLSQNYASAAKRGCNTSSIIHSIFFQLIVLMHVYGKYERPPQRLQLSDEVFTNTVCGET